MVDYKKIKRIIATTVGALAVSATLWVGVQQWQKNNSQKAFEKLPKAQQELVIKLRESKTPEKTIQINIDAYNTLINIADKYIHMVDIGQKADSVKITTANERGLRIWYKERDIRMLIELLRETKDLERQMTLLDETRIKELIASMEELKAQLQVDVNELKKLPYK